MEHTSSGGRSIRVLDGEGHIGVVEKRGGHLGEWNDSSAFAQDQCESSDREQAGRRFYLWTAFHIFILPQLHVDNNAFDYAKQQGEAVQVCRTGRQKLPHGLIGGWFFVVCRTIVVCKKEVATRTWPEAVIATLDPYLYVRPTHCQPKLRDLYFHQPTINSDQQHRLKTPLLSNTPTIHSHNHTANLDPCTSLPLATLPVLPPSSTSPPLPSPPSPPSL